MEEGVVPFYPQFSSSDLTRCQCNRIDTTAVSSRLSSIGGYVHDTNQLKSAHQIETTESVGKDGAA